MSETSDRYGQERESLTGSQILGLWLYSITAGRILLPRLDQERLCTISTKCIGGVGGGLSVSLTGIQPMVKQRCVCTFPPSPLLPLFSLMMLHAGQQYMYQLSLSCHHVGYHPCPSPLHLAGTGHRSNLAMKCHSQLARPHALCDADRAS